MSISGICSTSSTINSAIDVAVVGAGPVGLWTAIQVVAQMQLSNRNCKIVIFEKHEQYQRSHILKMDSDAFKGAVNHPLLNPVVKEFKAKKRIRTNEIEGKLKKIAQELGIEIRYQNITEPEKIDAKIIIGADGSHSIVREKFFGNEFREKVDLQYIVEIKYEVRGDTRELKFSHAAYRTFKLMQRVVTEHVGITQNEITPVTMRVFVNQETYNRMSGATFRNPYNFDQHAAIMDQQLLKDINIWLKIKKMVENEKIVKGSEKITVTRLSVYANKYFVKKDDKGRIICAVGDGGFGVPFFRSLNASLPCAANLASNIVKHLNEQKPSLIDSYRKFSFSQNSQGNVGPFFAAYANFVASVYRKEAFIAKIKNFLIKIFHLFVKVSNQVPWQVNKWSAEGIRQFESQQLLSVN